MSSGNRNERSLVTLNEEQREVLRLVVDKEKSVFFTGSAGAFLDIHCSPMLRSKLGVC